MERLVIVENKFGDNIAASKWVSAVCKIDVEEVCCAMNNMKNGKASGRAVRICLRNVEGWRGPLSEFFDRRVSAIFFEVKLPEAMDVEFVGINL